MDLAYKLKNLICIHEFNVNLITHKICVVVEYKIINNIICKKQNKFLWAFPL